MRTPEEGAARTHPVQLRLTEQALARVDARRGELTRTAWIRQVVYAALDAPAQPALTVPAHSGLTDPPVPTMNTAAVPPRPPPVTMRPATPPPRLAGGSGRHYHVRAQVIDTRFVQGRRQTQARCNCGEVLDWKSG
jgi:hypothetical protein